MDDDVCLVAVRPSDGSIRAFMRFLPEDDEEKSWVGDWYDRGLDVRRMTNAELDALLAAEPAAPPAPAAADER